MSWQVIAAWVSMLATIAGGTTALLVMAFRIGKVHSQLEHQTATLERLATATKENSTRLDVVPVLAAKVEQLEEGVAEERRRFASKFPDVDRRIATLEERTAGILRQSQGRFGE